MDGEINGHEYSLNATSPNRLQELDRVDQMLRDFNEENPEDFYLFDEDFRAKYFKHLADVLITWEDGFNPTKEFYGDGDFEVSELQSARRSFLANAGMIAM